MPFDRIIGLPFKNLVKLLIGGVLYLIPIINFFSFGYILECFVNGSNKREAMPDWDNWGEKFLNGFLLFVICLIYFLIPILFFAFLALNNEDLLIPSILLFLLFFFIIQMVIANFAVKKSFGAAFEIGYIFKLIGAAFGSYVGAYFLCILAGIIAFLLSMIPIVGWFFGILAGFYLCCIEAFLFGSVYGKASSRLAGNDNPNQQENWHSKEKTMGLSLFCLVGEYAGNIFELEARGCLFGRDPDHANLVLTSEEVSRQHALITPDLQHAERAFVEDLGSKNGTYIKRFGSTTWEKVTNQRSIKRNDEIRIGKDIAIFKLQ